MSKSTRDAQRAASLLSIREMASIGGYLDTHYNRHVKFEIISVQRINGAFDKAMLELDNKETKTVSKNDL